MAAEEGAAEALPLAAGEAAAGEGEQAGVVLPAAGRRLREASAVPRVVLAVVVSPAPGQAVVARAAPPVRAASVR